VCVSSAQAKDRLVSQSIEDPVFLLALAYLSVYRDEQVPSVCRDVLHVCFSPCRLDQSTPVDCLANSHCLDGSRGFERGSAVVCPGLVFFLRSSVVSGLCLGEWYLKRSPRLCSRPFVVLKMVESEWVFFVFQAVDVLDAGICCERQW